MTELKSPFNKIKYNTELSIYYGLFAYTEIITLIEEGAIPTGGYQYSLNDFKELIKRHPHGETYFYFKLNSGDLNKFGQKKVILIGNPEHNTVAKALLSLDNLPE